MGLGFVEWLILFVAAFLFFGVATVVIYLTVQKLASGAERDRATASERKGGA